MVVLVELLGKLVCIVAITAGECAAPASATFAGNVFSILMILISLAVSSESGLTAAAT